MTRQLANWLDTYVAYASHTEAPKIMHFWSGVSALAGALRRKVWIDQHYFRWHAGFYIIFVAPPGIVAKSTTADIAMELLREIPGINFGPDVITWQALVQSFAGCSESFEHEGEYHPMSALTLVASELGNLIDPANKDMVNLYINLWDGRKRLEKTTKMSGNDIVEAPWVNMIGCTTPHWLADNLPPAAVGGGFTSRCVFVYADAKEKFVAYPRFNVPSGHDATRQALIHDLEHISLNITGEYTIAREAIEWGESWYQSLWTKLPSHLEDDRLAGYVARKQTHMHKLSMIIAAAQRDTLEITLQDLQLADIMLQEIEYTLPKVFSNIGKSETAQNAERLIGFIRKSGGIPYDHAYQYVYQHFPDFRDWEGVLNGAIRSGQLSFEMRGNQLFVMVVK